MTPAQERQGVMPLSVQPSASDDYLTANIAVVADALAVSELRNAARLLTIAFLNGMTLSRHINPHFLPYRVNNLLRSDT
ncbi:MAG: hypothetical protein ABL860_09020 [Candidatus Nitrotoga sp.]